MDRGAGADSCDCGELFGVFENQTDHRVDIPDRNV
jgi:hypothetical protein